MGAVFCTSLFVHGARADGEQTAKAAVTVAPPEQGGPSPETPDPPGPSPSAPRSSGPQEDEPRDPQDGQVSSTRPPKNTEPKPPTPDPPSRIEACFSNFEQTQVEMKDGDLVSAAALAKRCSERCPDEITLECRALGSQIEREMPTTVLLARTERGTDAEGVAITIDGTPSQHPLSQELPLNPGPHSIVFSRADGWSETVDIVVRQGEKRRLIRVIVPNPHPLDPSPRDETRRGSRLTPWAIGAFGLGGVAWITAGALGIRALNMKAQLDRDCDGMCSEERYDRRSAPIDSLLVGGDVAVIVGVVGVATGTGLLIYQNQSKKRSGRTQIGVTATPGGASGLISGEF